MNKSTFNDRAISESVDRYKTILEYISMGSDLNEDGEDPNAMGGDPAAMGGDPAAMGGDPSAMGGDPSAMGGDPAAMGGGPGAMGGDPSAAGGDPAAMGGDPNAMGGESGGVDGFEPQGSDPSAMGGDPSAMGSEDAPEEDSEDEEVIDVDELTDSQEDTEKKVGRLNKKFDKLMTMLDNLESNLDANSQQLNGLRDEMEKRNPTPEEKLSLRSKDGYPFNVSVDDYWKDKEAAGNYSTEDDMNGEDSPIYRITKSDIDDATDWPSISKSLDDDSFHMNLKDIMGI